MKTQDFKGRFRRYETGMNYFVPEAYKPCTYYDTGVMIFNGVKYIFRSDIIVMPGVSLTYKDKIINTDGFHSIEELYECRS